MKKKILFSDPIEDATQFIQSLEKASRNLRLYVNVKKAEVTKPRWNYEYFKVDPVK